jgi:2-oxoglutarate dehydrogenase E1 component
MTQSPIFHINGDDPEAAYRAMRIALGYRQRFKKDVVLDVVGFRRLGHNETDEPSYTQPLMYSRVKEHPGVRTIYAQRLVQEGVLDEAAVNELIAERIRRYEDAQARAKKVAADQKAAGPKPEPEIVEIDGSEVIDTAVNAEVISQITRQISVVPEGFHLNPKMVTQLARRAKMGDGALPMDWAFAEAMAFGSLALSGTRVRLSGQDSGRGTFSQRHAVLYDTQTGQSWTPLSELSAGDNSHGRFEVFDSSLSEAGVLGFEYGFSVISKDALVMWEAQFGDFNNVAQSIIDQYITASEDKWKQTSRLTMLLPHGYEGQGPEHSSARLERFLQLCAANNICVCYPTTPAQYFHLLRRQIREGFERPLIVMTPKSLLRLPAASSSLDQLTGGGFRALIDDSEIADADAVQRIVFCSGKVFYDLAEARKKLVSEPGPVAIIRVEQFYPFPISAVKTTLAKYPNAKDLVWCQEEPKNMGGWTFMEGKFEDRVPDGDRLRYVGRAESPSPATGNYAVHVREQERLINEALTLPDDQ